MNLFTKTEFNTWALHVIWWMYRRCDVHVVMKMKSKFWGFKLLLRLPCFCYVLVKNAAQRCIFPAAEGVPSLVPHLHENFCSSCWSKLLLRLFIWLILKPVLHLREPTWWCWGSGSRSGSPHERQFLCSSCSCWPAALISQESFEPTDLLLPVVCRSLFSTFSRSPSFVFGRIL